MDERIKEIKIAVHNKEESKKVQEKIFELGGGWITSSKELDMLDAIYLFVDERGMLSCMNNDKKYFDEHKYSEIYVMDLLQFEPKVEDNWNIRDILQSSQGVWLDTGLYKQHEILKEKISEDINNNLDFTDEVGDVKEKIDKILDKRFGME